jgi:hypothetical protein
MSEEKFGFFKKVEIKDAEFKYGFKHMGVFAAEKILQGEPIFTCNPDNCDYLKFENISAGKTREETLAIMKEYPDSAEFIHRYIYMVDDDLFDWPREWRTRKLTESCMLFNHSCDPTCGFASKDEALVVAIRDIDPGEELTYDYQCMDTEISFYAGLNCRCGSYNCRGTLKFDMYRNMDWITKYYKYSGHYVKQRIDELKTKYFSARCYVKNIDRESGLKGLVAFEKVPKNELVALYSDPSNIKPESHYIRHVNKDPTCYLGKNGEVYVIRDLEAETELTLKFN